MDEMKELLEKASSEQREEMIKAIKTIDSDCMHGEMEFYLDKLKRSIKEKSDKNGKIYSYKSYIV